MEKSEAPIPLPFGDVPELVVEATAAAVQFVPLPAGESPRVEQEGVGKSLPIEVTRVDNAVHVRVGMPEAGWLSFIGRGGPFAFRFFLPKDIKAKVRCSAGMLHAERLEGCDLDLATSTGAIHLADLKGRLAVRADAGQIRGQRLSGQFHVEANAGAVRLHILGLDPGEHRIRSSMGSVQVDLEPGIKAQIEARTTMGSTRNRYPSTAGADAILLLEAELGSVRVNEARADDGDRARGWEEWRKHWSRDAGKWGDARKWAAGWETWSWLMQPERPKRSAAMADDELKRILSMVEQGKINAEEAERLIRAIEGH